MYKFIILLFIIPSILFAGANTDQWKDSKKTYKDLIEEGFEVKAYDTSTIKTQRDLIILFFVTVLQKDKQVYECQEYQTLDSTMKTLDISMICRILTQPYQIGVGT